MFSDQALGEAFNITYGRGYTLRELADTLKVHVPDLEINIVEEEDVFRPKRGALSIEKAKKLVGYEPKVPLEDGIKHYLDVYQKLPVFEQK